MGRVLVTGAAGFIGNKMMQKFQAEGYEVYGWDCVSRENVAVVDLKDEEAVTRALQEVKPSIVIHCAGSADVGMSVKFPEKDFEGNVVLTHNLLFALHKLGMDSVSFVFISSAGVYGNPLTLPITEDTPLNPLSPYAVHKVMCEELCKYFAFNYKMPIKVARIFSAYGAGLRKQIFWDMHKKAVETGRLDMFGTGNESRDYIHVNDVVESIYLMATVESSHVIFNVANGEEKTIREVTEIFAKYAGVDSSAIAFNGVVREGDPLNWRADISRITGLGYKKSMSMEAGLEGYCEWVKEQ